MKWFMTARIWLNHFTKDLSIPALAHVSKKSKPRSSDKYSNPPKRVILVLRLSLKITAQPFSAKDKNSSGGI